MKRLLDISSEERNRILEMHQSATKRNYLGEDTAQQKVPLPGQDIITQVGKSFNFTDVLSKWKTQNQGFSGNYYWVSKHNDDASGAMYSASVLSLYAFQPYGTLYQFFSLNYSNQTKKWTIQKYDLGNPSPQNLAADVLKSVVIFNPTELYGVRRIPIDKVLYEQFVKSYVTNPSNVNSSISKAFKAPLVPTKDTTLAQVETIKKSGLYTSLNTPTTPSTPTTPPAR
jgi:hypothetical protein